MAMHNLRFLCCDGCTKIRTGLCRTQAAQTVHVAPRVRTKPQSVCRTPSHAIRALQEALQEHLLLLSWALLPPCGVQRAPAASQVGCRAQRWAPGGLSTTACHLAICMRGGPLLRCASCSIGHRECAWGKYMHRQALAIHLHHCLSLSNTLTSAQLYCMDARLVRCSCRLMQQHASHPFQISESLSLG